MRALRLIAALVVAAAAIGASAQEGLRDRDPNFDASKKIASDLTQSTYHYGPFYLLSRFQLSDLGYSTEVFVPAATTPNGLSFAASAPQRIYFIPRKKVVLSTEVTPTYALVNQSGAHNQFGWTVRGDAQLLLNHLYLDFYGLGFNDLRASNAEIARVVTERSREAGLKSELKYSSRTSLLFNYAHSSLKHPLDRFQPEDVRTVLPLLDRTEDRFRGSFVHKTFPLTSLFVASELNDYKFTNDRNRDARRTYAGAGFNYSSGRTTWRLEAGPTKLNFKDAARKDYTGALINTTADHAIGPRIRLTAAGARDVDFSLYGTNSYYVFDRVQGTAEYSATRKLTLRVLSQFGRDRYDRAVFGIRRQDDFSFNGVGWLYNVRRLHGGFDIGYFKRKSNDPNVAPENGIRILLHLSFNP